MEALNPTELLLNKIRKDIATSLMLTASLLIMQVDVVDAEKIKNELDEAHERIRALSDIKKQLDPVPRGTGVAMAGYLTPLCESLTKLVLHERDPITLRVNASTDYVSRETAISLGIITTELVINALKYAFPDDKSGNILVTYDSDKSGWTLKIDDDGIGQSKEKLAGPRGLGSTIVKALADQLHAEIKTVSSPLGTKVSIGHVFA